MILVYEKNARGDPRLKPWATSPLYLLCFSPWLKPSAPSEKAKTLTFSVACKATLILLRLRRGDPRRPKAKALGYQPWAASHALSKQRLFQQPLKPRSNPEGSACVGCGEVWAEKRISPLRCSR